MQKINKWFRGESPPPLVHAPDYHGKLTSQPIKIKDFLIPADLPTIMNLEERI